MFSAGFVLSSADADHPNETEIVEVEGCGSLDTDESSYIIAQGDEGSDCPHGYIGVNDSDGVIASCGTHEQEDDALDVEELLGGGGDTSCLE